MPNNSAYFSLGPNKHTIMLKQLLAAFAGFVLWSVGWLSFNLALQKLALLPSDQTQRIQDTGALLALLLGSITLSLAAGHVTAVIAQTASNLPGTPSRTLAAGRWHLFPNAILAPDAALVSSLFSFPADSILLSGRVAAHGNSCMKRPNRAMPPTAGRRTAPFSFMKIRPLRATRALASGG